MEGPHVGGVNATDASEEGGVDATKLGDIVLGIPNRQNPGGLVILDGA